ncbi:hypothetical protein EAX61_06630 [Dokdonia sinensis]|uniref:Uncharacterized protein n=2 Tax=Dokdonia sinensis TaxID=2479847 RepID=A0A3M0GCT3_9FLAO|nr:hypothetical protein EAX61_06630 [Dokdonia sinensis]
MLTLLVLVSCNTVKTTTQSVDSGDFDHAIQVAIKKLDKNPDKKRKQPYILLLEEAYAKVVAQDEARIAYLEKDGDKVHLEEIYNTLNDLKYRQTQVKRLLPLYIEKEKRAIVLDFKYYDDKILAVKSELTDYLYAEAVEEYAFANLPDRQAGAKKDHRSVYNKLSHLNELTPNFKDVNSLMAEVKIKGTDFVSVQLYNDAPVILPFQLERELLDFSTYGLDDFWTEYHTGTQNGIVYDYNLEVGLREINVSPEHIFESLTEAKKVIKDGTEFQKDEDGNYVLDKNGDRIVIDKLVTVTAEYYEYRQSKAVQVQGRARFVDLKTNRVMDSFPLASEFIFTHHYADYEGDKRALTRDQYLLTRNRPLRFPTDEQMVFDAGEDLKENLKQIVRRQRFVI